MSSPGRSPNLTIVTGVDSRDAVMLLLSPFCPKDETISDHDGLQATPLPSQAKAHNMPWFDDNVMDEIDDMNHCQGNGCVIRESLVSNSSHASSFTPDSASNFVSSINSPSSYEEQDTASIDAAIWTPLSRCSNRSPVSTSGPCSQRASLPSTPMPRSHRGAVCHSSSDSPDSTRLTPDIRGLSVVHSPWAGKRQLWDRTNTTNSKSSKMFENDSPGQGNCRMTQEDWSSSSSGFCSPPKVSRTITRASLSSTCDNTSDGSSRYQPSHRTSASIGAESNHFDRQSSSQPEPPYLTSAPPTLIRNIQLPSPAVQSVQVGTNLIAMMPLPAQSPSSHAAGASVSHKAYGAPTLVDSSTQTTVGENAPIRSPVAVNASSSFSLALASASISAPTPTPPSAAAADHARVRFYKAQQTDGKFLCHFPSCTNKKHQQNKDEEAEKNEDGPREFSSRGCLQRHLDDVHTDLRKVACSECGFCFAQNCNRHRGTNACDQNKAALAQKCAHQECIFRFKLDEKIETIQAHHLWHHMHNHLKDKDRHKHLVQLTHGSESISFPEPLTELESTHALPPTQLEETLAEPSSSSTFPSLSSNHLQSTSVDMNLHTGVSPAPSGSPLYSGCMDGMSPAAANVYGSPFPVPCGSPNSFNLPLNSPQTSNLFTPPFPFNDNNSKFNWPQVYPIMNGSMNGSPSVSNQFLTQ